MTDVIDQLVGIGETSPLHALRLQRPAAYENAQKSFEALFAPADPGTVTLAERLAIALFVAGLHRHDQIAQLYRGLLEAHAVADLIAAVDAEGAAGATAGPYGTYPAGPLSTEDKAGPVHKVSTAHVAVLGGRLAAALEHAHLLVFRPRDASPAALQALLDASWTTTEVVTLSQIVAFLSFQIRVVQGLTALATAGVSTGYPATAVAAE